MTSIADTLPPWLFGVLLFVLLAAAGECGAMLRHRLDASSDVFNSASAAVSLLALLIGFTFSVALGRYDARRDLVVEEAAAITQMWQRVQLEAEPRRSELTGVVRGYLDERLNYFAHGVAVDRRRAADMAGDALMDRMWAAARAMSEGDTRPVATRMLIDSLARVDDAAWRREAAGREHIPLLVIDLLNLFALLTAGIIGYTTAIKRGVNRLPNVAFFLMLACAIVLVLDLDRPRTGLVRVSQQPMLELQADLAAEAAKAR